MKVSSQRRCAHFQLTIFPDAISGMPQTRNLCGDFVEEWAAKAGNAARLATDGTCDYCPDLTRDADTFYETKSAGRNGSIIIYEARREKDRQFCASGPALIYWIVRHDLAVAGIENVDALREGFAKSIRYAIALPFSTVDKVAGTRKLKLLNRQYGGTELGYGNRSKGYGYGRSIPVSVLVDECNYQMTAAPARVQGSRPDF